MEPIGPKLWHRAESDWNEKSSRSESNQLFSGDGREQVGLLRLSQFVYWFVGRFTASRHLLLFDD